MEKSDRMLKTLTLKLLKTEFGVCRLGADEKIPAWCQQGSFYSMTRTSDELSIVCEQQVIPPDIKCERDWRIFKILGPLDFSLIGILAQIGQVMAEKQISIFALSTYDTDYILVRLDKVNDAEQALIGAGYQVIKE